LQDLIMQGENGGPVGVPVPVQIRPASPWRAMTFLFFGGVVGLVVGILATIGAMTTYQFFSPTLSVPNAPDSMQVLNELNELRHQVNQLNGQKQVQAQDRDESMRRAMAAISAAMQARANATSGTAPPAGAGKPGVAKGYDPFAELDAEIKNLEATQTVLNTLLDLFLSGPKEPGKERSGVMPPPK
jgi:hypothetical protein